MQKILTSFTLDMIALTLEKERKDRLCLRRRKLRTGKTVTEYDYQITKCFGILGKVKQAKPQVPSLFYIAC